MLLQAVGAALPAAMAIALSPFPVIGIVLIVASPHGRRNGPLFAVGWMAGLAAVAAIVTVLFAGADDADSSTSAIADWARVIVGGALVVLGVRTWRGRPRGDEPTPTPAWMASLDDAGPGRALVLGVLLSAANPKNLALAAAATASMVEVGVDGTDLVVAIALFVLVASWSVLGAVVVGLVGGRRGHALLDGVRRFMVANNTTIMVIVLLLLGASVLGDGLAGLGR